MSDCKFGCCISEVIAPYVGVSPQFVENGAESKLTHLFQERRDTIQQEAVVVIVFGTCGTWVCMVMSNCL